MRQGARREDTNNYCVTKKKQARRKPKEDREGKHLMEDVNKHVSKGGRKNIIQGERE